MGGNGDWRYLRPRREWYSTTHGAKVCQELSGDGWGLGGGGGDMIRG
jgi:hypothetical protein